MTQNLRVRIAVISDVHANLYALEAVLGEIDRDPPDEIWCLGDTVGYGPRPNECCDVVRDRSALTLVGNHDLVALAEFSAELALGRWLLNPGSVGQPRDGDPRAAFLRIDLDAQTAQFERIAYPVARTQAEIRERGLPDSLAERLAHGV